MEQLEEDDFRRTHPFGQREDLQQIRESLGPDVTRGALQFVLRNPAVTGAIVGIRNEREAREVSALPVPVLDVPERPVGAGARREPDEA